MIYLDHAATSWPKPPEVMRAVSDYVQSVGGSPGPSRHPPLLGPQSTTYHAREALARFFNAREPNQVVFTLNATNAINLALHGLVRPGDRVVTSSIEHDAVMGPLRALEQQGVRLGVVPVTLDCSFNLAGMAEALQEPTRLVVITHASNVIGTVLPVTAVAEMAHAAGALLLVDAALTAGVLPIDVQAMDIDLLAFTGHKGLQGMPGVGGLVLSNRFAKSLVGTLPDQYECGMINAMSIAGLSAGLVYVQSRGIEAIWAHENELARVLSEVLSDIPGVTVYGPRNPALRAPVVSFTVAGHSVSDIGLSLEKEFGIVCRVGLHDAPAAHRTIGTLPEGTIRFAPGPLTTTGEIYAALEAVEQIAMSRTAC